MSLRLSGSTSGRGLLPLPDATQPQPQPQSRRGSSLLAYAGASLRRLRSQRRGNAGGGEGNGENGGVEGAVRGGGEGGRGAEGGGEGGQTREEEGRNRNRRSRRRCLCPVPRSLQSPGSSSCRRTTISLRLTPRNSTPCAVPPAFIPPHHPPEHQNLKRTVPSRMSDMFAVLRRNERDKVLRCEFVHRVLFAGEASETEG